MNKDVLIYVPLKRYENLIKAEQTLEIIRRLNNTGHGLLNTELKELLRGDDHDTDE